MLLRDLQSQFSRALLDRQPALMRDVIVARGFDTTQRLNVYRNNINATLCEALEDIYPSSYALVGEEFFKFAARAYVRTHAPHTGDLRDYGEHLPALLQSMPETQSVPYLPDIARIDWACHIVFHAERAASVKISALNDYSADDYAQLLLNIHPAIRPVGSDFPIFDIWDFASSADPENAAPPSTAAGGQSVLAVRRNGAVMVVKIETELCQMIALALSGKTLGSIIPSISEFNPEYNLQVGLNRLFSLGAVSSITLE